MSDTSETGSLWLQPARTEAGKFLNPVLTTVGELKVIFRVLPLWLANHEQRKPVTPPGPFHTDVTIYRRAPGSGLRVTWFGHSAMLVEIDGLRILIDPVWEERASPQQWFGPKRFFAPTLRLEELPPLDAVLLSHDHYDHLGETTIRALAKLPCTQGATWVMPLGVGALLQAWCVPEARIVELNWMQTVEIKAAEGRDVVEITAVPARHFSGRSLFNRFTTLWGSFALKGPAHAVYYGADTGWWDGFRAIAERFGPFDMTMLEIGAYNELWKDIHLGPDNAMRAFQEMGGGGLLMPIHWGLFDLALHGWKQPIERLGELAAEQGVALWSPEPGRPTEVVKGEAVQSAWWHKDAVAGDGYKKGT